MEAKKVVVQVTEEGLDDMSLGNPKIAQFLHSFYVNNIIGRSDDLGDPTIPFADLDTELQARIQAQYPDFVVPSMKVKHLMKNGHPFAYQFEYADGDTTSVIFDLPGRAPFR